MSNISIHASACKHILRTVPASTYTYQSHPIDFNTPYCPNCLAVLHSREREAAPEPEDLGMDYDMEDCARGVARMGLEHDNMQTTSPWASQIEEGYMADGEQHMPQYAGECGIVYDSIDPRTPVQRSPPAEKYFERDGAAPFWSVETSSFADGGGFVGSFSPLQDDGLGVYNLHTPPTSDASNTSIAPPSSSSKASSSCSSSSSIKKSITERAEARARYEASRDRNRLGRLMDKMSELCIVDPRASRPHSQDNGKLDEPEHIIYLRHRLIQAQSLHETLGAVDEDFERRYGFDLLEVEGGLEMCLDAGFGLPGE